MKKQLLIILILVLGIFSLNAQNIKTSNFPEFNHLKMTEISGAPKLNKPVQIQGTQEEIIIEKHGLAAPALFDINKDGLLDLLVGEFETGKTGSYIKVYLNEGSKHKPKFSGKWEYLEDIEGNKVTEYFW